MNRRWRARTPTFAIIALTLFVAMFLAGRTGRVFLRARLEGLLPPETVASIVADYPQSYASAIVIALLLAAAATLLIGWIVIQPFLRLRGIALARARGEEAIVPATRIAEAAHVANAIDLLHSESRQRASQLARERDEFAGLVASVSEGILRISDTGRIMHANPAARSLLGLPDHVDGQAIAALVRNIELRMLLERAAAGRSIGTCEVSMDDRRILVAARPLGAENGSAGGGIVVALADLTELRRLESVRRDFVANVSHELKTPLTSIRGYVETLMTDDLPADMQRQFLEIVLRNAERLHRIVDDLLDLSRLESGGWRPEMQDCDPREIAEDVWVGFRERGRRGNIRFAVDSHGERVLADPDGLRQVLSNLFDNALRYTPENGRITVHVATAGSEHAVPSAEESAFVAIEVRDTGTGIPHDALPRVFERFYRVDPARSRAEGGTGLGLSIVKHLVERMGGDVSAASELGRGTTIRIRLPAKPQSALP